ncbi:MAG TPA: Na(+)-translocating NADH-quinone reductase subunit A [bacterium]|nr:Na(+)-translocating NADH-quinone reductase subunit A [bacterium]HPN42899.1 Na(+)-translocating NADH-quinone reductase subunit A [bacterium]
MIKIKKGLNLPVYGEPVQEISAGNPLTRVALLGQDYIGLRPTMLVKTGDVVKLGQVLFTDKKMPGVNYTAPGSGTVIEINRGDKRAFVSLVIELGGHDEMTFTAFPADKLDTLARETVTAQLLQSGAWTSLRARPFGRVADPTHKPHSIFITAMDTNPLAPSVEIILKGNEQDFKNGIKVLARLTEGTVYLCKASGSSIPVIDNVCVTEFAGPHPAGNAGTHIHFLDPVGRHKTVWHINAQDVVMIGRLFTTGKLDMERVVALTGAGVVKPRLIKTRIGASIEQLLTKETITGENRFISGSILYGYTAAGAAAYLGRFHQQISVIRENHEREFFGWLNSGFNRYSVKNIVLSKLLPRKKFPFNTSTYGGHRAIVPVGSYEKVMPMDILATYLLRALAVDDVEEAEKLGCLELIEEDLALCTFVCPSKIDHTVNLRRNLNLIEKEG